MEKATGIPLSSNRDCPEDVTEIDRPLRKNHGNKLSQWTGDGKNCLTKDLRLVQPSIATTSSSSKVSGTCKIKVNFKEVKSSPVESVSSFPLRICNPENLSKTFSGKDEATNAGLSLMNGPRRCSESEVAGGSNWSETIRKEKDIHRISVESFLFDYPSEMEAKDHCHVKRRNDITKGSPLQKSVKGSASWAKENQLTSRSGSDIGRILDSSNEQKDPYSTKSLKYEVENESIGFAPSKEEMSNGKVKTQGFYGMKSGKIEKGSLGRKVSLGKHPSGNSIRGYQSKHVRLEDRRDNSDTICLQDGKSTAQQNLLQSHEDERFSNWFSSVEVDKVEVDSRRGNSKYFPFCRDKLENLSQCSKPFPEKVHGSDVLSIDGSDGWIGAKASKQFLKDVCQNEPHQGSYRHPTPNMHGLNDVEASSLTKKKTRRAPSPIKKETSSHAANNALREAKDLKHSANHLKISGSGLESTELFFQAALKFLHGASLIEPCNSDRAEYGEMTLMEVYGTTAKLCEHCAHEYERCKDMASAALAYKCMEVSYMRLIYSSDFSASRDRHELQMLPSVESPSSSASDVDYLNSQVIPDKKDMAKDVISPQLDENYVIAARNRPNFVQLLNFAQYVNFAMEASRKSQNAFTAASIIPAETGNFEGISCVKRVLNFSFHDVEGLLHLVHYVMEALSS